MAVTFDGGVVLGADSRTSSGSYVANRVSDKIVPLHDYVWTCRSGSAADTQAVADYVKYYIDAHRFMIGHCSFDILLVCYTACEPHHCSALYLTVCSGELDRLPRVETCANLVRKICYNNKDRMMAGMICGGWDPYEGGQVDQCCLLFVSVTLWMYANCFLTYE